MLLWPTGSSAPTQEDGQAQVFGLSDTGMLHGGQGVISSTVTSACIRHGCEHLLGETEPTQTTSTTACLLYSMRDNQLMSMPLTQHWGSCESDRSCNGSMPSASVFSADRDATCAVAVRQHAKAAPQQRPQAQQVAGSHGTSRAIEAGASLLACPPGSQLVVMQMPRGNLEGMRMLVGTCYQARGRQPQAPMSAMSAR